MSVAYIPQRRGNRRTDAVDRMLSPPVPVNIDFVKDGTSKIPTQNVAMTATACNPYMPYSAVVTVGGNVVTYRNTNCSKIIRNAIATTGTNEY